MVLRQAVWVGISVRCSSLEEGRKVGAWTRHAELYVTYGGTSCVNGMEILLGLVERRSEPRGRCASNPRTAWLHVAAARKMSSV